MNKRFRAACVCALGLVLGCRDDAPPQAANDPATSSTSLGITLRTDGAGLAPVATGKGTMVKLSGQFENAVLARRNPNGTTSVECFDNQQQAEAFALAPAPRSPANLEVK
jgi:hypothetical protein